MSSVSLQSNNSINIHCIGQATKRLHNEYKKFNESPPEKIKVAFQEDWILEWHFLFTGLNGTPFEGGQYHGTLMFPEDYPFSPPSVQFITPNGRFKTDERVCFSLSDFHPECWKPAYTVSAVLQGVYSFMMSETTETVGSLERDKKIIRELAGKSREFNFKDGSTELFQNEIKAALTENSNFDTDIPLLRKSQSHSSDISEPTVSFKEANTTESIDIAGILVETEKEREEIARRKRKWNLKDGSANLHKYEIKVILPKLSDADTNPPLNKKSHKADIPSPQKTDHNSYPETLEQDVQFYESIDDEKVSIIPAPLPDERNECSEMNSILKEHGNIRTRSCETESTVSFGANKKEKLTAKSSSGKGKLDKYICTANHKPKAKNQFSTKSLHQSSPISKDCLAQNESGTKHGTIKVQVDAKSLSEGDRIKAKSTELLKGLKLVIPSLKSIYTKSHFEIK